MKLLFPNGEHDAFTLRGGANRVGSDADAEVRLAAEGIAPAHCVIHIDGDSAKLAIPDANNVVVINGRQAADGAAFKVGDLLLFARVGARVVAGEKVAAAPPPMPPMPMMGDDDGHTRVRMALPRFMLRGVSGVTFGKTLPLYGSMVIGRQADCEISIPSDEISRRHARLEVTPNGVRVEDLGSSNGTYVNDKRVENAMLKVGDELRLDTLRFQVTAPGMETPASPAKPAVSPSATTPRRGQPAQPAWVWMLVGVGVVAVLAA
ncbi:MAG: FHA domain-containing protein, partial [Lysobacterales bacterium]